MKQSVLRRLLSVLLCVSLLLGVSVVRPQKAEAFAISASVVASVIMIMTACGVTFWASTQGDAESYISEKLGEYLDQLTPTPASILDWLGITDLGSLFVVLTGGVARFDSNVANKILDFVRWFNREEGVVTDGEPVGILGGVTVVGTYMASSYTFEGSVTAQSIGDGIIRLTFADVICRSDRYGSDFCVLLSGNFDGPVSVEVPALGAFRQMVIGFLAPDATSLTGRYLFTTHQSVSVTATTSSSPSSADDAFAIGIISPGYYNTPYSGSIDFRFTAGASDVVQEREVAITPSSAVSVPDNVSDDDSFDVAPSVPLTEGMSIDDASSEIFDGVTSADGLTSTGEAAEPPALDLSGILEILGSILNAILAIPEHIAALPSAIASAFSSLLTSIKSVLDSIDDWVASIAQTVLGLPEAIGQAAGQAAQDVITGIHSLPGMISDALVNLFVPDEAFIGEFVASLHGIFDNRFSILSYPFSILGEFITRASGIDEDEPILRWPDIYEPFSGQLLIGAGSYNLNQIRQGNFAQAHGLYMVVVKGWIAFEFLGYLYSWFCSVFKMREDDFVSPLEAYDGGDDG